MHVDVVESIISLFLVVKYKCYYMLSKQTRQERREEDGKRRLLGRWFNNQEHKTFSHSHITHCPKSIEYEISSFFFSLSRLICRVKYTWKLHSHSHICKMHTFFLILSETAWLQNRKKKRMDLGRWRKVGWLKSSHFLRTGKRMWSDGIPSHCLLMMRLTPCNRTKGKAIFGERRLSN